MRVIERYEAPATLEEALRFMTGGEATIYAGGTDLVPRIREGLGGVTPLLLNIRRIPALGEVSLGDGVVRVGALCTVANLLQNGLLRDSAPILAEVADHFASGQVRNSATIGGNLCNASPAADLVIPLLLLDAEVELAAWSDAGPVRRTLPLHDFFMAPGVTRRRPEELLTGVRFPIPAPGFRSMCKKFGTRPAMDIAVVSVGIGGRWVDGALHAPRVAFGAVAPVPLRGRRTEAALAGKVLDDGVVAAAVREAAAETAPISDVRASAWYRTELIRVMTRRSLEAVRGN
ncbi:MAG: xanthine dehydrogenase family protein subunit M [Pseudomonadota bacterium]